MTPAPKYPCYRTIIIKGQPRHCRAAYGVLLVLADRHNRPYLHHFESFFGDDGRKVRAAAMRFASAARKGRQRLVGYRQCYIGSIWPQHDADGAAWPIPADHLPTLDGRQS